MASLNSVTIDLKVKGEATATRALEKFAEAGGKVGTNVVNLANKVSASVKEWSRLDDMLKQGIITENARKTAQKQLAAQMALLTGLTKEQAAAALKNAEATRQAAAAEAQTNAEHKRAQQSYNQLRASIDQSYAARMRLKQAADTLRAAERQGIITREQAIEQLRQYRAAAQQTAQINQLATRRQSALGVVFQQTGYQVGDFAVQVQSGTHYMVALGQQLTQLVGVGAMLAKSTRWIAAFSVLGVIVPITTAIVGAFMRARDAAEETQKEVDKLSDTISKLNSVQKTTAAGFEIGLTKAFGNSASAVGRLLTRLREAEFAAAMEPVSKAIDDMTISIDRVNIAIDTITTFDKMVASGQSLSIVQQSLYDEARQLVEQNLSLAIAYQDVRSAIDSIGQSKSTEQLIVNFSKALEVAEKIGGPAAEQLVNKLLDAAREAGVYEEIMQRAEDATSDSANSASSLANEMSRAANEALRFVANLGSGAGLAAAQARVAGLRAELSVRQAGGGDVAAAEARARTQAMADPRTQLALQGPAGLRAETLGRIETEVETARLGAIASQISGQISDLSRTGGKGGGAGKEQKDYLLNLQKEAELKLRMIGLSEEEQRRQEIIHELTKRELPIEEERIQKLLDTEEALRRATDAEQRREDLMNTIESNIENAMMALVDGSKSVEDAFRDMLRNILMEIYKQAVVQPIASGIGDFIGGIFGSANGNAFRSGNIIPFANGGVVSGPTLFPMRGAQTGLMGEAGPEAIMPLKRGKGGKLGVVADGASQPIVINQSFNFSANGDESVKRIIAQEAPKIANLTQKQIIEQRQRGGTMKSVFS